MLPLSRVPNAGETHPVSSGVAQREGSLPSPEIQTLLPAIVESMPTPIVVIDDRNRIVVENPSARSIFSAQQLSSMVGYSLGRFLSQDRLSEARLTLLSRPGPFKYQDSVKSGDAERLVDISANSLSTSHGEFMCLSLFDRTDTDRERAEWGATSDRAAPLLHLERAHHLEALGHLTGTFAHDFNNLLAVILGSLEAAERRMKRDEHPVEDIQRALTATERSIQATSQILHYVRRRSGEPEVLNPGGIIVELRGLIERAVGDDVELIVDTRHTGRIRVAAAQLETALLNLVINARDAISGGGTIEIALAPVELTKTLAEELNLPQGEYVSISVTDSGCGMSEDTRAHAFEPFFTTKPEGMGTGLGLSSVCGIMRSLGGSVVITSELGQGTRVELLFPSTSAPSGSGSRGPNLP